jgi:membrane-bound metal-dependent hydrolase YbcI (DUF457 family)
LIGLGLAAAVAEATGTPASPALWIGAVIASGLPDLDMLGRLFGPSGRWFHRHATHSILVLAGLILMVARVWPPLPGGVEPGIVVAMAAALLSHPLLDLMCTGPVDAARGAGIALLWPVVSRRWFLRHPLFAGGELMDRRSHAPAWKVLLPEVCLLVPVSMVIVLLGRLF